MLKGRNAIWIIAGVEKIRQKSCGNLPANVTYGAKYGILFAVQIIRICPVFAICAAQCCAREAEAAGGDFVNTWIKSLLPLGVAAVVTGGLHILSAATRDRCVEYTETAVTSPKLPTACEGYKIAFLTDIHAASPEFLRGIVQELNRRQIDLLLLGGDFLYKKNGAQRALQILSHVRTRDGIWGVRGNHDRQNGLFDAMRRLGMHPLRNSGTLLPNGIYLAGVDDWRTSWPDADRALAGAGSEHLTILLSHNPDAAMQPSARKADIVLCGHTHGGQVTLFGLWAPSLTLTRHITSYGQKFRGGWTQTPLSSHVFVSRGIGSHSGIPRIFARPQVVCLQLHRPT